MLSRIKTMKRVVLMFCKSEKGLMGEILWGYVKAQI